MAHKRRRAIGWDKILWPNGKIDIKTKKGVRDLIRVAGFPRPFKVGTGAFAKNHWWEDEVDAWIEKRARETRKAA